MAVSSSTGTISRDARVIGLIGAGHFLSHFYIFLLPPLFPLLKTQLGVDYTALGLAMTLFNVASGFTHVPMGFLVDRFGARTILIAGLVIEAAAFGAIGILGTYEALLPLMLVAGVANAVYHPADYAILSASVGGRRMGRAFSLHTFAGYAGGAAAPPAMVTLALVWHWQAALVLAGVLGLAVALLLVLYGDCLADRGHDGADEPAKGAEPQKSGMALLLSPPIFMCFLFFAMLAMSSGGLNSFAVASLTALHGMSLVAANVALTAFLVANAVGILVGGWIADRTHRHERVAVVGFGATAVIVALIGTFGFADAAIVALLAAGGLLFGMIMPSRDMMVRQVTPPGAMGKVFGFVSVGLNIGSALTPLIFGWLLDNADPRYVFWLAAAFMGLALLTVLGAKRTR